MYDQIDKNDVKATNQLKDNRYVRFENPGGKGIKVMFAGNSITLHSVKEEIGWFNEWGMAASKKENDYVHILMDKISDKNPDASFCICQVAPWEVKHGERKSTYDLYDKAKDFEADIIIARFIENCSRKDCDIETFKKEYCEFLDYLNSHNNAKIILSTSFWRHPFDKAIEEVAEERNYPLVILGDLGEQDSMKALGLFEHSGVANHPGDEGMKMIAERIFEQF